MGKIIKLTVVVQIVTLDSDAKYYESNIITDHWHGILSYSGPRTICGIQLDNEDGYGPGVPQMASRVTCSHCITIINEILDMVIDGG